MRVKGIEINNFEEYKYYEEHNQVSVTNKSVAAKTARAKDSNGETMQPYYIITLVDVMQETMFLQQASF